MVYVKKCPNCKRKSYSASKTKNKKPVCPYCNTDLKKVKVKSAED